MADHFMSGTAPQRSFIAIPFGSNPSSILNQEKVFLDSLKRIGISIVASKSGIYVYTFREAPSSISVVLILGCTQLPM